MCVCVSQAVLQVTDAFAQQRVEKRDKKKNKEEEEDEEEAEEVGGEIEIGEDRE